MRGTSMSEITPIAPVELTVEQFIEAFRQKFGRQFVGNPAMRLVEAIQQSMRDAEEKGFLKITNLNEFLPNEHNTTN